jgi:hypothetical protein
VASSLRRCSVSASAASRWAFRRCWMWAGVCTTLKPFGVKRGNRRPDKCGQQTC